MLGKQQRILVKPVARRYIICLGIEAMLTGIRKTSIAAILALFAAGCADPSSSRYTASDVGQIIETSEGTVVSSRVVDIKGGENSSYGAAAGGATGGTAGDFSTGGSGLVTILGAIIGAGVGYLAEDAARSREGYEYMVQMDDGRIVTLVQNREGEEPPIQNGTPVFVQYGSEYTRIVAKPDVLDGSSPGSPGPSNTWQNPDKPSGASGKGGPSVPDPDSPEVQ